MSCCLPTATLAPIGRRIVRCTSTASGELLLELEGRVDVAIDGATAAILVPLVHLLAFVIGVCIDGAARVAASVLRS